MQGKTVIVTGAGSGIGLETADALARKGALLILVEVNPERGRAAVERISRNGPTPKLIVADLSLRSDVERAAREILDATHRIDVLINNAGAWFEERQVTPDGLEKTFALNHMGYFLLTNLLLGRIIAGAPARIISVASDGHVEATLDFDDLQTEKNYTGRFAYCRSKLANILFTRALARRLAGTAVTANCLHPGRIITTFMDNIGSSLSREERFKQLKDAGYSANPADGARTSIYLASSPEVEGVSGAYFDNCTIIDPAPAAQDDMAAERLWAESLRLAGGVFTHQLTGE